MTSAVTHSHVCTAASWEESSGADEADCPTCLTLLYLLARFGACLGFSGTLPERENNQNQLFPC